MQETLYQTADAVDCPSDSGCRRLSIRMQETLYQIAEHESLYQTADAGVSLDSGCRSKLSIYHSIRQQTANAGDSLSDSGCRRLSMHESL